LFYTFFASRVARWRGCVKLVYRRHALYNIDTGGYPPNYSRQSARQQQSFFCTATFCYNIIIIAYYCRRYTKFLRSNTCKYLRFHYIYNITITRPYYLLNFGLHTFNFTASNRNCILMLLLSQKKQRITYIYIYYFILFCT